MFRPPNLVGRENREPRELPGDGRPVMIGIRRVIISSRGRKRSQILGVVRHRKDQTPDRPWENAAYAA